MATTLKDIHERSGKNYSQLHDALKTVAPKYAPKSLAAVQFIIQRGTDKGVHLQALSEVYNLPFAEIVEASEESRRVEKERVQAKQQIVIEPLQAV